MIKIKEFRESGIVFTNGWRVYDIHLADCCEHNYADYKSSIEDSIIADMEFDSITIEPSEYGFLLNGYQINCYSEQNGYYSNELDIYLVDDKGTIVQEITVCGEEVDTW